MATLKFGNGNWASKKETALAYNDENSNFKPLPFTFDRASSATVVNKDGLIETVGTDEPRIDFLNNSKGHLLLEPSRSNNLQRSQEFDNSVWGKDGSVTITPNYSISPDGTQNAERFQKTATGGNEGITQNIFGLLAGTYTLTFYIKSNTDANQNARLLYGGFQSSSILITPDWQRFQITYTANTSVDYNGILSNEALDISIWGAQLEQGSYATSYIPTQGETNGVTRSAESCKQENLLTDIINASYPFTMYVDGKYNGQLSILLSFLNIAASQQFFLIYIFNNEVIFTARSNGTIERIQSGINLVEGEEYKIAVAMESTTSGKICVNGNSVTVKNNFSSQIQNSNITDLLIGQERVVSDDGLRNSVSGVKLYNTALTDEELIALTS